MNCTGKYLKVWEVEDKGSVKIVNLGDSRKAADGQYENCTWFKCLFCGDAAKKPINVGDKIEITSGQIFMEKYNEKWSPKVKVFHFDVMESTGAQQGQSYQPPANSAPFESYNPGPAAGGFQGSGGGSSRFEDDIPFGYSRD